MLITLFTFAHPMHLGIGCCRQGARLFHTNHFNVSENGYGRLASELAGNALGLQNYASRGILEDAVPYMGILGGALSLTYLVWGLVVFSMPWWPQKETGVILVPKPHPPGSLRDIMNGNQPHISLEGIPGDMSTYVQYASILEYHCAPIQLNDPTYMATKINFDNAVLHEMLKFKGNSKNIPKPKEMNLIM